MLVEVKLYSPYLPGQLGRYVNAAQDSGQDHSGVIAITRTVIPSQEEREVQNNPKWLGAVRWRHVLDDMREPASLNGRNLALWQAFLEVCERKGDFGTMINADDMRSWARSMIGREMLQATLAELRAPMVRRDRRSARP